MAIFKAINRMSSNLEVHHNTVGTASSLTTTIEGVYLARRESWIAMCAYTDEMALVTSRHNAIEETLLFKKIIGPPTK